MISEGSSLAKSLRFRIIIEIIYDCILHLPVAFYVLIANNSYNGA